MISRHCERPTGAKQSYRWGLLRRPIGLLAMTVICISFSGCQTTQPKQVSESTQEVTSAVGSVAGALSGQNMTDEEMRKVVEDLQNDKEGQSAMRTISGAMDIRQTGIKYCPVDGKRFSADLDECPEHKVKLKDLVE